MKMYEFSPNFPPQNQLREEMNLYRQYLAEQAKEEERVERELDALINSEVAKQWAKRTEQWKREREARAKLMQEVIESRKQQIKEKCKPSFNHRFRLTTFTHSQLRMYR